LRKIVDSYKDLAPEQKVHVDGIFRSNSYQLPFELAALPLVNPESDLRGHDMDSLDRIAKRWAEHSPSEAAEWYENLPAVHQTPEIASQIAEAWQGYNEAEAAAWKARVQPTPASEEN
jgi:hypothetical protein